MLLPVFVILMFSMSLLSLSADHWAIFPNLSDKVIAVVATIGTDEDTPLSSDPEDSAPGEPGRFFLIPSFLIRARSGCCPGPFSPSLCPGFRKGLGGGGLVLGSVGLSLEVGRGILLATGGVMGRGILLGGGEGEGLGGRGREEALGLGGGGFRTTLDADGRGGGENERDLERCLVFGEHTEQESSEQLLTLLAEADRLTHLLFLGDGGVLGLPPPL